MNPREGWPPPNATPIAYQSGLSFPWGEKWHLRGGPILIETSTSGFGVWLVWGCWSNLPKPPRNTLHILWWTQVFVAWNTFRKAKPKDGHLQEWDPRLQTTSKCQGLVEFSGLYIVDSIFPTIFFLQKPGKGSLKNELRMCVQAFLSFFDRS